MELTPWTFAIVLPLVALAGFVDAAAGGGGLISLPAYLAAGLPAQLASGTNKMGSVLGTALATAKYAREGRIAWRAAIPAVVGALPGAALGARLLLLVPEGAAQIFLLIAVPVVAVVLFFRRDRLDAPEEAPVPARPWPCARARGSSGRSPSPCWRCCSSPSRSSASPCAEFPRKSKKRPASGLHRSGARVFLADARPRRHAAAFAEGGRRRVSGAALPGGGAGVGGGRSRSAARPRPVFSGDVRARAARPRWFAGRSGRETRGGGGGIPPR